MTPSSQDPATIASEIRSYLSGGLLTIFGTVAVRASLLFNMILIGRLLGQHALGVYSLVYSFAGTISLLALLGVNTALTKLVPEMMIRDRQRLGATVTLALVWTTALSLALAALAAFYAPGLAHHLYHDATLTLPLWLGCLIVVPATAGPLWTAVLFGMGEMAAVCWISMLSSGVSILLTWVLVLRWGTTGAVVSLLLFYVMSWLLSWWAAARSARRHGVSLFGRFGPSDVRLGQSVAVPSFIAATLMTPALFVLNTLVARTLGLHALGLFAVAIQLFQVTTFIPGAVSGPTLAFFARAYVQQAAAEFSQTVAQNLRLLLAVLLPLISVLILSTRFLIPALYGAGYGEAIAPALLLLVASVPMGINSVLNVALLGASRAWQACLGALTWFVLLLASAGLSTGRYGLAGVALAVVVSYGAATFAYVWLCRDLVRFNRREVSRSAGFLLGAVVLASLLGGVRWSLLPQIATSILFYLVLAAGLWKVLLTADEKRLLATLVPLAGWKNRRGANIPGE